MFLERQINLKIAEINRLEARLKKTLVLRTSLTLEDDILPIYDELSHAKTVLKELLLQPARFVLPESSILELLQQLKEECQ